MISVLKRAELSFEPVARCLLGLAFLLAIAANSTAQAQTGSDAIYGVTTLDVAPEFVACDLHLDYRSTESTRASKDFLVERDGFEPSVRTAIPRSRYPRITENPQ